ncbi:hypothetical protein ACFWN5_44140 [Streptomyces sp. NPDC058430]|uniref:hypothetical protein n=1 Tax=Streptomyces sp. NPDC058430 TaxID=3346495 RepID=UPI0036649540
MIFFINLPVGAAALLLLARTACSPHRPVPFDVTGQITAVIAMGALTFAATEAGGRGFTAPAVWGAALLMLAALTAPYARFTTRLNHILERVGLALAGRAGARLANQLGLDAGRMTMLRRVMALPDPQFSTPRVLGVDDFAIRRGQTYSTVLSCGESHHVVDVLPTREAGPLADQTPRRGVHLSRPGGCLRRGCPTRWPRCSPGR